jgi:hypothetical protein
MPFDELEACEAARTIITDRSPAAVGMGVPHLRGMIPTALELWRNNLSVKDKELLKTNIAVNLSAGQADLSNYTNGTSNQIDLHCLRKTTIYTTISGVRTPFTWVNSQQQLNYARQLDDDAPACFLDGYVLRTRNTDGSLTSLGGGTVEFTAIDYPSTVSAIPTQLQESFVLTLVELAIRGGANERS